MNGGHFRSAYVSHRLGHVVGLLTSHWWIHDEQKGISHVWQAIGFQSRSRQIEQSRELILIEVEPQTRSEGIPLFCVDVI
jgi:hypothetical protein